MKKQLTAKQLVAIINMKNQGIKQTIIAKKIGVSDATVSNWVAKLPKTSTIKLHNNSSTWYASPKLEPKKRSLLSRLLNRK